MRKTSLDLPDSMHRQLNVASAAMGLSAGELMRCAIRATLDTMAQKDSRLKAAFDLAAEKVPA